MKKNILIVILFITSLGLAGWSYFTQQSTLLTSNTPVNLHVPQQLKSRRMLRDTTKTADFHKLAGKIISYNEETGEYVDLQKKVTLKRRHPSLDIFEEVKAIPQIMLTPAVEYHSHIESGANLGCEFLTFNANAQTNQLVEVHITDIAKASIDIESHGDWLTIARQLRSLLAKNTSGEKTYWIKDLVLMKRTTHILTDASITTDGLGSLIKTNGKLYYRAEEGSSEYLVGFDIFDVEKFIECCKKRGLYIGRDYHEEITALPTSPPPQHSVKPLPPPIVLPSPKVSSPSGPTLMDEFKQALEEAKYIPQ